MEIEASVRWMAKNNWREIEIWDQGSVDAKNRWRGRKREVMRVEDTTIKTGERKVGDTTIKTIGNNRRQRKSGYKGTTIKTV
jgi:hypothetical protein